MILLFDHDTSILSIKGIRNHPDQHLIYYGNKNDPAALSAKTALSSINYDFGESRTLPICRFVPQEQAIEIVLPEQCFRGDEAQGRAQDLGGKGK